MNEPGARRPHTLRNQAPLRGVDILVGLVLPYGVMRLLSGAVALAYVLGFFAVCLGACVSAASADEHACCAQRADGSASLKTASTDCCKVIASVGSKLTNSTSIVLTWNGDYLSKLKIATSNSEASDTRLTVALTSHPAVTGVGANPTILSSSSKLPYGTPPTSALKLARLSTSSTRWAIFAIPGGGKRTDGSNAPACRVGFAGPQDWRLVTSSGWQLFDQTVTWALGGCQ